MGDIRCRKCSKNALECGSYLKRAGRGWVCAGGCNKEPMTNEERILGAIRDK